MGEATPFHQWDASGAIRFVDLDGMFQQLLPELQLEVKWAIILVCICYDANCQH